MDTVSAFVVEGHPLERVALYLPANYAALPREDGAVSIVGVDTAGWTLEGYVLPRLASGGMYPAHLTPVHGQVPCVVGDYVRQLAYALTDARRDLEAVTDDGRCPRCGDYVRDCICDDDDNDGEVAE